jgi:hypothetical protein
MEQEERTHMQGFNDGYKLNLYSPHLFEKLKDSLSQENEYEGGLIDGALEADKERERQRMKQLESLRGDGDKNIEQEKDDERDR